MQREPCTFDPKHRAEKFVPWPGDEDPSGVRDDLSKLRPWLLNQAKYSGISEPTQSLQVDEITCYTVHGTGLRAVTDFPERTRKSSLS